MSKEEIISRVEADLAQGHTYLAAQRLASLTSAHPGDLEIRARRGALNRQIGNFAEAGRWGYLTEDVDPGDIRAFERTYKLPSDQLRALKLRFDHTAQLGPVANARLEDLTRRAGGEPLPPPPPAAAPPSAWWEPVLAFGCGTAAVLGVLAVITLAIYGFLALFDLL